MSVADLPVDLLSLVLRRVLSGGAAELTGQPLRQVASQWIAIKLTCKFWAALLSEIPLFVDVSSASPAAFTWLSEQPVRLLRIGKFENVRERRAKSVPQLAAGSDLPAEFTANRRQSGLQELTASNLLASLQFTPDGHKLVQCSLSDFKLLEVLHLKGALSPSGEPCSLQTTPLRSLNALRSLHLERFTHFNLSGLPPSLQTLRLRFQETPMYSSQEHPSLDVIQLPADARLRLLDIDSRAAVGLLCTELLEKCKHVVVRATRVYMGVIMPPSLLDVEQSNVFYRAHLSQEDMLLKADIMYRTAGQFIAELAGDSSPGAGARPAEKGGRDTPGDVRPSSSDHTISGGCAAGGRQQGEVNQQEQRRRQQQPGQVAWSSKGGTFAAGRCVLKSIEFRWMCANTLVFVPIVGGHSSVIAEVQPHQGPPAAPAGGSGLQRRRLWFLPSQRESCMLAKAQEAVHEGEEPVVDISARCIADLAERQKRGSRVVTAEFAVNHHQDMFLRLQC